MTFASSSPPSMRSNTERARDSRTLHFHNRQYLKSSVNLLSASIRVDWFSLPMEKFLDRMPQLRQGLVKGVFLTKASSPWAGNKSQSIQVSLCLPNQRDLDTWYEAVFALPLAWPDITDIDPLTTSRRPLPISSSLSACKWGYPTCGEVFRHSGTY